MSGKRGVDFIESVGGKRLAIFPNHHDVRAVVAELFAQLGLHVHVKIEHGRGDSGGDDHGEEGRGGASATEHGCTHQHAQKHRGVRLGGATADQIGVAS